MRKDGMINTKFTAQHINELDKMEADRINKRRRKEKAAKKARKANR